MVIVNKFQIVSCLSEILLAKPVLKLQTVCDKSKSLKLCHPTLCLSKEGVEICKKSNLKFGYHSQHSHFNLWIVLTNPCPSQQLVCLPQKSLPLCQNTCTISNNSLQLPLWTCPYKSYPICWCLPTHSLVGW